MKSYRWFIGGAIALVVAVATLLLLRPEKEEVTSARLSIEEIEKVWQEATPAFREAVFAESLANAGITIARDGSFLAREPLLGADCSGEVIAQRSIKIRGDIPESTVRAIVRTSACFTLNGRWG